MLLLVMACDARGGMSQRPACSPEEVLRNLGIGIVTGDEHNLGQLALGLSDLIPAHADDSPDDTEARKDFDSAIEQDLLSAVRTLSGRYRGFQVSRVKAGSISRQVRIEGMDIFVDEIRDSRIVLEQEGKEVVVTVANLIEAGGCWKVEHFGTGAAGWAGGGLPSGSDRRTRPPEGTGFRRFARDFCTGLGIYASEDSKTKVGVLVEGYRAYRDPGSGRLFEAVRLRSLATGHVQGVWMSLEQLTSTYVDRRDHALQDCAWSVREQQVEPLPEEVPAVVPKS